MRNQTYFCYILHKRIEENPKEQKTENKEMRNKKHCPMKSFVSGFWAKVNWRNKQDYFNTSCWSETDNNPKKLDLKYRVSGEKVCIMCTASHREIKKMIKI